MSQKKPDNVVYNTSNARYDAGLKSYGTNVGAPSIQIPNIVSWKGRQTQKANQVIEARYKKIHKEYQNLMEQLEINELIYNSRYNFEPVIGQDYHLYKSKDNQAFLSVMSPFECDFHHLGSFSLNADGLWEPVE